MGSEPHTKITQFFCLMPLERTLGSHNTAQTFSKEHRGLCEEHDNDL